MRPTRYLIQSVIAALLCLCVVGASLAAVVTIDPAAKTGSSDVDALEVRAVRVADGQVGFFVQSNTETPQKIFVKTTGLQDQDYDVYVNDSFVGTKPGSALREGFDLEIPGSIADPNMMRCIRALDSRVKPEYERIRTDKNPEVMRVAFMFNQVVDFVNSSIRNDKAYRSAAVMLVPSGKVLQKMVFLTRHDAETTARGITRTCWLTQKARDIIYDAIKDPVLRNTSLITLTPVNLTAAYSVRNGKPHIEASVTNNCDLPVSGAVTMALPKGWKSTAKNLSFADLKSGETHKLSFDLVPPKKGAAAPPSVPMAATVKVFQDPYMAEVKFRTIAAR